MDNPKVFISYSWSNPAHMDWVVQLATDLRSSGVDAVLDKWDLKEGQDAHSFMEQTVQDEEIKKVILVCDDKYVARANRREGGVGVESQIITGEIYGNVEQTKFVGIVRSSCDDGRALLPNFLLNRIFIDFRNEDEYSTSFSQLLRWIYDKPLFLKPEVGPRPTFLDEQISFTAFKVENLELRGSRGSGGAGQSFAQLWRRLADDRSDLTVQFAEGTEPDDTIVSAIHALRSLISEIILACRDRFEDGRPTPVEIDAIATFFESCVSNYQKGSTKWSADVTKFFANFVFISVVAMLLRYKYIKEIDYLLGSVYLTFQEDQITASPTDVTALNANIASLNHRNSRLKLNRATLNADMAREVCGVIPLDFGEYVQADFVIYLYFEQRSKRWWPDSNIFAADRHGSFPIFLRATSEPLRSELLGLLLLASSDALSDMKEKLRDGRLRSPRWSSAFSTLDVWSLGNFEAIMDSLDSS